MIAEGTELGPYRIVKKIGEGGMGSVYLVHHTLLGRRAAIKVLLPALSSQREVVDRFFNEARATTAVANPGIVQVFDFGFHTDRSAYIVMELLEGESLESRLRRGTISVADALRITRQVAGSLAAAHAVGIVHRDLKPENLMMVRDVEAQGGERPKILDFGIAKLTSEGPDRSRTRTGMVMGTPIYMSPEQCRGAGSVDHRADIYSLGCVLYHLLAGRPPFDFEGVGEIISAHLREPPRRPSELVPSLPPAVDDLVLRCLAKAPGDRFQSMLELQGACEAQLARITGAGAMTIAIAPTASSPSTTLRGAAGQSSPPVRRNAIAWVLVASALALGGVSLMMFRRAPESTPAAAAVTIDARAEPVIVPPVDAALPLDAAPPDAAPPPPPPPRRSSPKRTPTPQRPSGDLYDAR